MFIDAILKVYIKDIFETVKGYIKCLFSILIQNLFAILEVCLLIRSGMLFDFCNLTRYSTHLHCVYFMY